jgi:cell division septation protein DedD
MKNKDYRELQISSTQLVIIFFSILILGVVIFLLGVSVGKKQVQIADNNQILDDSAAETLVQEKPTPLKEAPDQIQEEIASHQQAREKVEQPPVQMQGEDLYFVQVGAFNDRNSALNFAETFKERGYTAVVLDPLPTDRRSVYRVRIGGYRTREDAIKVKADLAQSDPQKMRDYFVSKS